MWEVWLLLFARFVHSRCCNTHIQWTLDTTNPLYNKPPIQRTTGYNKPSRWAPPWRIQVISRPLQQIPGYNELFARVQKGSWYPGFTVDMKRSTEDARSRMSGAPRTTHTFKGEMVKFMASMYARWALLEVAGNKGCSVLEKTTMKEPSTSSRHDRCSTTSRCRNALANVPCRSPCQCCRFS